MTVLADDPLIAGMAIAHPLPLHESSGRLRELYPACPRVYGVAVMTDVGRRRWWPLVSALTTDRLRRMFVTAGGEMDGRAAVVDATLRVLPTDPAGCDNVVRLPSEAALATWTAH